MSFFSAGETVPRVLGPDEGTVLEVLGELITIKAAGQDTGGAYTVIQEASPPQGGPPLHLHHWEDEAFYVLEGEYEIQMVMRKSKPRLVRSSSPPGRFDILSAISVPVRARFWYSSHRRE